jgi:hypothetical protein
VIAGGSIRYDAMPQEAKDDLLRFTVYAGVFGGGDADVLDEQKDALLAAGAQWKPSPYNDRLPMERDT